MSKKKKGKDKNNKKIPVVNVFLPEDKEYCCLCGTMLKDGGQYCNQCSENLKRMENENWRGYA